MTNQDSRKPDDERFWDGRWGKLGFQCGADNADRVPFTLDSSVDPELADAFSHSANLSERHLISAKNYYASVERQLKKILKKLRLRPTSLLDLGAGAGHRSDFFHRQYAIAYDRVAAVDVAEVALDYVQHRCPGIVTRVAELGCGGLQGLGHFDLAVAIGVLHHVVSFDTLVAALDEITAMADRLIIYPVHQPSQDEQQVARRQKHARYKSYWTSDDYAKAIDAIKLRRDRSPGDIRLALKEYGSYLVLHAES